MKCIILAAGYATRLYPLTENFPKPLLMVGKKTIVDWLIDDLKTSGHIDEFIIVTNHKYVAHFIEWSHKKKYKVHIVDNNTTSNDTRLGAVRDIEFAINELKLDDDLLILAGDNVLDFSLNEFVKFCLRKNTSCVMRYFETKKETLINRGVLELDGEKVVSMQEKPLVPKSQWCCPPFYFYKKNDAKRISEALNDGCGFDAPGSLVSWLCKKTIINAMEMPGKRYDIGDLRSYEAVKNSFMGIK